MAYDVAESLKVQTKYCNDTESPHFAPKSGQCWNCRRNIYEKHERVMDKGTHWERRVTSGITVEKAASELVTGCPHCNRSYCN